MNNEFKNNIQEELNHISFRDCENILVGDVLYYPIFYINSKHKNRTWLINLLRLIKWYLCIVKRILLNKYQYKTSIKTNSLFLFSSSYGEREDLKKNFMKVKELVPKSAAAIYDLSVYSFSCWKLKYLSLFREWDLIIKDKKICNNRLERIYLLFNLINAYCDYKDAECFFGNDFAGINTLISFCDVHAVDSFFTQKFNAMNRNTVNLMHGSISDRRNSWTVFGIKSHFFIADSQFTKDLLIRNGYRGEIFVCGYPYNINKNKAINKTSNERIIGVILSARELHDENLGLCHSLSFLKGNDYKIIAKLHPNERKDDYESDCLSLFSEIYEKEITSSDFLNRISFAIISPSTVVYEAIYNKIPFVLYSDSLNIYKEYGMPDIITANIDEIEEKTINMLDGRYNYVYDLLTDYYIEKGSAKDNYIDAFEKIGIH